MGFHLRKGSRFDLTGKTFGRLTVLHRKGIARNSRAATWLCQCTCGNRITTESRLLNNGNTTSCGCAQRDYMRAHAHRLTHGESKGAEYKSWCGMKDRCYNRKNPAYDRYGGRGITVCVRWRNSFERFLADMGRKPSTQHSLDRFPNNDGDYEPANCRWATMTQQVKNRRRLRRKRIGPVMENGGFFVHHGKVQDSRPTS